MATFSAEGLALRRRDAVQSRAGGGLDFGLAALAADAGLFGGAERRGGRVHGGGFWAEVVVVVVEWNGTGEEGRKDPPTAKRHVKA